MCKKAYPEKGEKCCPHQKAVGKRGLCQRCERKLAKANARHYRAQEEALRAEEKQRKEAARLAAEAAERARWELLNSDSEVLGDIGDSQCPVIVVGTFEEFVAIMDEMALGHRPACQVVLRS